MKRSQPDVYQVLLMNIGATDTLRGYSGAAEYWRYVQMILDCFFTAAERAEICADIVNDPLFIDDPGFEAFAQQARAEIRCYELVLMINATAGVRASLRSIG